MISHSSRSVTLTFEDLMNDCILVPAYRITSINDDELFHLRSMQQCLDSSRCSKHIERGVRPSAAWINCNGHRQSRYFPARFRYCSA